VPDELDTSVFEQASRGDDRAIELLIERHLPALLGYLRLNADQLIRQKESCADVAQSVCREILEDMDDFVYKGEGAFLKWLFFRARIKLVDRHRYYHAARRDAAREIRASQLLTDARLGALYTSIFSPVKGAIAREAAERLESAFRQLPDNYREVIILSRLAGQSHAEIGRELDKSPENVRVLLHRALVRLGRIMNQERRG